MKTASILLTLALAAVSVQGAPRGGFGGGFGGAKASGKGNTATTGTGASNNAGAGTAATGATGTAANSTAATGASGTAANSTASTGSAASNSTASTGSTASTASTGSDTASTVITATGALSTDPVTTNATANNPDPQLSTTLDPRVIASGFFQNGQNATTAAEGQVASLTSPNNFINYCLTQNTVITNGLQVTTGSCNPAPIGTIPSVQNMPSTKFSFPANGGTVQANTAFNVTMNIQNIETGNFVNAEANYFAAPQQLNSAGQIVGHTHVVIEALTSSTQTTPPDPQTFAFFKGIDGAAVDGSTSADVTAGVPAGSYRLCSITSSANHQPAIVAVAQHGNIDDCIYFEATDGSSANATAATGAAAGAAGAAAGAASAAGADSATAAAATAAGAQAATAAGSASGATATTAATGATAQAAGNNAAAGKTAATGKTAAKGGFGKGKRMMYSRL